MADNKTQPKPKQWFRIYDSTNGNPLFAVESVSELGAVLKFRRQFKLAYNYRYVVAIPMQRIGRY
jgi:hypothetical protein